MHQGIESSSMAGGIETIFVCVHSKLTIDSGDTVRKLATIADEGVFVRFTRIVLGPPDALIPLCNAVAVR